MTPTYAYCDLCDRDWFVDPDFIPDDVRCRNCGEVAVVFGHPSLLEGE